ncbi:tautomerase enzyme [Streptomyces sp. NPDC051913]|uniref:tautomerase enzyme n=1 Tax=Streptomyces sp. NPDC051913 TaxID=3365676 RepID=UPI0037D17E3A
MTVITVHAPKGRLTLEQRRRPAEPLTDAVPVPEVGRFAPPARAGFQVHFVEREPDMTAIGGRLPADAGPGLDVMVIDVTVMDGDWRACGLPEPWPAWWVTFRVVVEGSWGSSGGVLSIPSLLESGVFTEEKAKAIRAAIET